MNRVSNEMVVFDAASRFDPIGRVFYYQDHVYRAVRQEAVPLCNDILQRMDRWQDYGVIRTRKAPFILDSYALTLWHEKIIYRSYCMEWLPEMLRDAALNFLSLNRALVADAYVCKDAHPWNTFFQYCRPMFIDIGSITYYRRDVFRATIAEFLLYYLLPLVLFEKEGHRATYTFLRRPIPNTAFRQELAKSVLGQSIEEMMDPSRPEITIGRLTDKIAHLNVNDNVTTAWSNYDQKAASYDNPDGFIPKQRAVYDFLLTVPAGDLLDVGCNNGWFSLLAEKRGHRVVALDNDVTSISRLYRTAKDNGLKILTLYGDFSDLTPRHGMDDCYPSFEERYRFDVIVAMAMVHHLCYTAKMSFDDIARKMATLSKRFSVVEFIPKEDVHVRTWDHTGMHWYDRPNFIRSFLKYFHHYEVVKSSPDPREVFIFSK